MKTSEDLAHERADRTLKRLENKFARIYSQANRETQEKLKNYLKRFAEQDEKYLKLVSEGKMSEGDYRKWYQSRVIAGKQWQNTLDTLAEDYARANRLAVNALTGELPEIFAENFNYTAYLTEQQVGADLNYQIYDRRTVERLARDNPRLLPKPRVDISKDLRWNKQKITSAITQGIIQGEAIRDIAKRLKQVTDMNSAAAVRNARTAVTGAQNAGRVDSYKRARDIGVNLTQVWIATLDGRTRHSHAMLDGESIDVDGTFSNGCRYPGDPMGAPSEVYNCRCTVIGRVKGYEHYHNTRWIEDGKEQQGAGSRYGTGKLEGESYYEWKARHIAASEKKR